MADLDATSPEAALRRQFYVPPPGPTVADRIVARASLQPSSSQVVVGGIGSGKSTELLIAASRLNELEDTTAIFVDVSAYCDLTKIAEGALVVIAGLVLCEAVAKHADSGEAIRHLKKRFERWAHGYWDDDPDYSDDYGDSVRVPGVLTPPKLPESIAFYKDDLEEARDLVRAIRPNIVLLFDSLDRIGDVSAFLKLVESDVALLAHVGIGTVVIGPLRSMFGSGRASLEIFDEFHHMACVDTDSNEDGRRFLTDLLRRRAPEAMLPDASAELLARQSGGILRDLFHLARSAAEQAYMRGRDQISPENATAAGDAFGRKLMSGLDAKDIEVLQRVRTKGTFVQNFR